MRFKRDMKSGAVSTWDEEIPLESSFRPHVCLFGEQTFHYHNSMEMLSDAELYIQVGTASLVEPARFYIDKISDVVKIPSVEVNSGKTCASRKFAVHIQGDAQIKLPALVACLNQCHSVAEFLGCMKPRKPSRQSKST